MQKEYQDTPNQPISTHNKFLPITYTQFPPPHTYIGCPSCIKLLSANETSKVSITRLALTKHPKGFNTFINIQ